MRKPASSADMTLRYVLSPDPSAARAIEDLFARYVEMGALVTDLSKGAGSNLRTLHDKAYGAIREKTGLPARLITLGFRDFTAHDWDPNLFGIPLDEGLFTIKGPDILTISTIQGRVEIPYDVAGYSSGWSDPFWARLVRVDGRYEVRVGVTPKTPIEKDRIMARESILSRAGRLLAGVANSAIDQAEAKNPTAVVEQAIREIDKAAEDARVELGKARAEEYRITTRRTQLHAEIADLNTKIELAVRENRDDLARAAVAREIDLESQIAALDKALAEVEDDIRDATQALSAVNGARREAETRLVDLKKSLTKHTAETPSGSIGGKPDPRAAVEKAGAAIDRVTGVPGGLQTSSAELEELDKLARDRAIDDRLARFKQS